jgi:hypothetical protein
MKTVMYQVLTLLKKMQKLLMEALHPHLPLSLPPQWKKKAVKSD